MALHFVLLSTILAFALASTEQSVSSPTTRTTTSTTTPNACPHSGYQLYAGFNCYKAFHSEGEMTTWSAAREQCVRDGGDLAVMESQQEIEVVYIPLYNSVDFNSYPWVGVYIPEGGNDWVSVKGQPARSSWWTPGEPEETVAFKCAFAEPNGLLGNFNCTDTGSFICEISL